jgi:D-glycero-D-manno-heptose 1,7-bisphosphate phosphatase
MKIVVLDRDGVINQDSDNYIKSVDEFIPIDGSIESIARLSSAGFTVVVATNQSGLARNLFSEETLSDIHHYLCSMVEEQGGAIHGFFYCPHLPDANCNCRKPNTGLLEQIESEFNCDVAGSYFIGDSLKDIQAARSFNCVPILVRTGKGLLTECALNENAGLISGSPAIAVYDNLSVATTAILDT